MTEFAYVPAEPGGAYALSVLTDGFVQIDVDLFEAPNEVAILLLARDRG